jgi:hypothetical protein
MCERNITRTSREFEIGESGEQGPDIRAEAELLSNLAKLAVKFKESGGN